MALASRITAFPTALCEHGIPNSALRARITFLLLVTFWQPLNAHSVKLAKCIRAYDTITIDGRLHEWSGSRPIRVAFDKVTFGAKPKDNADCSYILYTFWDDANLYIAAYVRDNSIIAAFTDNKIYENDCLEICLDVDHDSDEASYGNDDYQFVFSVPVSSRLGPLKRIYRNPTGIDPTAPDVKLAYGKAPGGYVLEAAIPWKTIGLGKPPKPLTVLGFQNSVRDKDGDRTSSGISWLSFKDPAGNPLQFGHLILLEDPDTDITKITVDLARHAERYQGLLLGISTETNNRVVVTLGEPTPYSLRLGFGWNVQFYDGRLPDWSDKVWDAYLALLKWSRPAWVRYGLNLGQWEPVNDDGDPENFAWEKFRFDSPLMLHHLKMFDFFEAEGIDVMLCNWYVGDPATNATWLAETKGQPKAATENPTYHLDGPSNEAEFIESMAALIHFLKVEKKYTCIKFLSLWNEPDGNWTYNSPKADYPFSFWPIYKKLHGRLEKLGLRDKIQLAGPDSATGAYHEVLQLSSQLEEYHAPLDLIADHDYAAYFDHHRPPASTSISTALKYYAEFLKELDATCKKLDRPRPLFAITEYGNYGNGPGPVEGNFEVLKGAISLQEFALRALPLGIDGFLRWEFKPYGKSWQNFGALTTLERGYRFAPYAPVFYPHAMLTRYSRKGSKILSVKTIGGTDSLGSPRVNAAAVIPEAEQLTLWLTNSGQVEKSVTLVLGAHQEAAAKMGGFVYTAKNPQKVSALSITAKEAGTFHCTLPARSSAVFTTLESRDSDALQQPMKLAPKLAEPKYETVEFFGFKRLVAHFNFEEPVEWNIWRSVPSKTSLGLTSETASLGKKSCLLDYEFISSSSGGREEHLVATTPIELPGQLIEMTCRIRGDGSGHLINFLLVDEEGETFECPKQIAVTWKGWKKITIDFRAIPKGWFSWGEASDKVLDYPLRGFGLIFREKNKRITGRGKIHLDDIRILTRPEW